jgi:hypothetical protein
MTTQAQEVVDLGAVNGAATATTAPVVTSEVEKYIGEDTVAAESATPAPVAEKPTKKKGRKAAAKAPVEKKPKKARGEKRVKCQTQINKKDFAILKARAKAEGVTVADVVRDIIYKDQELKAAKKEREAA